MGVVAGPLELLDHEPPTSRPFKHELGLTAGELSQPPAELGPRCGRDPTAAQLTRPPIDCFVRDLASMHIQSHYDRHRDLLELRQNRHRVTTTPEPRGSHYMSSLYQRPWRLRSASAGIRLRPRPLRCEPCGRTRSWTPGRGRRTISLGAWLTVENRSSMEARRLEGLVLRVRVALVAAPECGVARRWCPCTARR